MSIIYVGNPYILCAPLVEIYHIMNTFCWTCCTGLACVLDMTSDCCCEWCGSWLYGSLNSRLVGVCPGKAFRLLLEELLLGGCDDWRGGGWGVDATNPSLVLANAGDCPGKMGWLDFTSTACVTPGLPPDLDTGCCCWPLGRTSCERLRSALCGSGTMTRLPAATLLNIFNRC